MVVVKLQLLIIVIVVTVINIVVVITIFKSFINWSIYYDILK